MKFFTNDQDWICVSDAGDFVCGIDKNGINSLRSKAIIKCTAKDVIELGNKMNEIENGAINNDI